jgi:ketosteroid isomerase-like protein
MSQDVIDRDAVVEFLGRFEEIAGGEDFSLVRDMIHEQAFFRFNDGDFVGRQAIQAAFEKTWKGVPGTRKVRFYLSDIVVLSSDRASASATYTYNWEGVHDGQHFAIQGRGTRVLVKEQGRLQIIHEHLSRFPKAP